ncbi:MAG: hypothetical protein H0U59_04275 [Gemmatimonadaceae bacterium]|nr:hypothetical protein [Gemmatimonadaceae bacterium]
MKLKRSLYRKSHPAGPTKGQDVIVVAHGLSKHPNTQFSKPPEGFDDVWNELKAEATERVQRAAGISATGNVGQATFDKIWPYVDDYRRLQYKRFEIPSPPEPPLVEPHQGFASLDESLWKAYSLGRRMGLSDLGTYNPASTLPSGAPSDHSVGPPAFAFDLGIEPDTGFQNPVGRAFFEAMVGSCGYVILGDRIWSQARASEGVRTYTGGGHLNHVHCSGNR